MDAGWSVQFVMSGITWTAAELWSVNTPTLKSLISYVSFVVSYKCRLPKTPIITFFMI